MLISTKSGGGGGSAGGSLLESAWINSQITYIFDSETVLKSFSNIIINRVGDGSRTSVMLPPFLPDALKESCFGTAQRMYSICASLLFC